MDPFRVRTTSLFGPSLGCSIDRYHWVRTACQRPLGHSLGSVIVRNLKEEQPKQFSRQAASIHASLTVEHHPKGLTIQLGPHLSSKYLATPQ
jgi:hypothetical protein